MLKTIFVSVSQAHACAHVVLHVFSTILLHPPLSEDENEWRNMFAIREEFVFFVLVDFRLSMNCVYREKQSKLLIGNFIRTRFYFLLFATKLFESQASLVTKLNWEKVCSHRFRRATAPVNTIK